MAKKIEEMDFYEVLNLRLDATGQEVREAYDLAVATYHPDALASYGVLSAEERGEMLDKIEKAFQTLGDAAARKAYDTLILPSRPSPGNGPFSGNPPTGWRSKTPRRKRNSGIG